MGRLSFKKSLYYSRSIIESSETSFIIPSLFLSVIFSLSFPRDTRKKKQKIQDLFIVTVIFFSL